MSDIKITPMKSVYTSKNMGGNTIKPIVQGIEQLQKLRIATGNRIAAIARCRANAISVDAMKGGTGTVSDAEAEVTSTLSEIAADYCRITDTIVKKGYSRNSSGSLPTPKSFKPSGLINTYSELILVDQYLRFIDNEEINIGQLSHALKEYPIWTEYLSKVGGIGPKLGGVIISEIDPYRTKYVASLWAYAGLDTVIYGEYTDDKGVIHQLKQSEIDAWYRDKDGNVPMTVNGYPVQFKTKGRDKTRVSLTLREYTDFEGNQAVRNSITFNPYLKTKLIGVLGSSFLKQQETFVDGEPMSGPAREEIAVMLGYVPDKKHSPTRRKAEVISFLRNNGYTVEVRIGKFAQIYYNYRARLENSVKPEHKGLTPGHINARAIRYMVKAFLRELYVVWRHMEGLPIYKDYATAKLGYTHDACKAEYAAMGIDVESFVDPEDPWVVDSYPEAVQEYVKQRDQPVGIVQNEALA